MGGAASKKFEELPLGTVKTPLPKENCIDPTAGPLKETTTFTIKTAGTSITSSKVVVIEYKVGDAVLYTSTQGDSVKGTFQSALVDSKGKAICWSKFEVGFGKFTTRVMKPKQTFKGQESKDTAMGDETTPVYNFVKMSAVQGYKDKSTWSIYTAAEEGHDLYKATKVSNMKYLVVVETADGTTVVGKVKQGAGDTYIAEVAAGADPIAVIALARALKGGDISYGAVYGAGLV